MSMLDIIAAAVTPTESDQARREARSKAQAVAGANDWLSMVLDHHMQVEAAFGAVKAARDIRSRVAAQKRLGIVLTGHSNAEESVLYPALARADEKAAFRRGARGPADPSGRRSHRRSLRSLYRPSPGSGGQ